MENKKGYILITGVSTGIGYAAAKYLTDRGFFVFGSVRRQGEADRMQEELGQHFQALLFDVTDAAAIAEAVQQVKERTGHLLGLVNNAGLAISGPLRYLPLDRIRHQFEVNVFGMLSVTQAFIPLLDAGQPPLPKGRIVNISSVSGIITSPFVSAYSASKFAMESLSDGLRRELMLHGIDVIVIQPGPVKTPIWQKAANRKDEFLDTEYGTILSRMTEYIRRTEAAALPPEAVAEKIHHALTAPRPRSRYIVAKGGRWLPLFARMPDRWLDRLMWQRVKGK